MTVGIVDDTQRTAARVVGDAYVCALVPAVFAELYVRGQLVVSGNTAQTGLDGAEGLITMVVSPVEEGYPARPAPGSRS